MKEYIEREAVEEFILDGLNNPDKDKAFGHDAIEILAEIHFMLAADVAPVRHGRWIKQNGEIPSLDVEYCSECGQGVNERNQFWDAKYCPNCGAKMDGEES